MAAIVMIVLSCAGFLVSIYATLVRYKVPGMRRVPGLGLCLPDDQTCDVVFHHPHSRLMGIFNGIPGMVYFVWCGLVVSGLMDSVPQWLPKTVAAGSILVSLFLMTSLVIVVRKPCVLCYVAHAINMLLSIGILFFPW